MSMKLTAKAIRALKLSPGKNDHVEWDDDLPSFGLRLRATGAKTFICQYDVAGKSRKVSLGSPAVIDPGQAREAARRLLAQVRLGADPASEKREARARAAETIGAILPRYLQHKKAKIRSSTYRETERYLLVHCKPLHGRPIAAVARRDVALRLSEIAAASGAAAANKARGCLGAFYSWALREGLVEANPVVSTNKATENGSRDRVLTDAELVAVWRAAGDLDEYGIIVRLLMLTGARRQEIGGLQQTELDPTQEGGWVIQLPAERTKNGTAHEIPLSGPALDLLEQQLREHPGGEAVFGRTATGWQNWSSRKYEFDARLGDAVAPWTLHDLRRTVSTVMNDKLKVEPHIVEAILNHARGGVAGIYNRALYRSQKRRALELWSEHVKALVEDRPAGVVPLRA
jgi:integrase